MKPSNHLKLAVSIGIQFGILFALIDIFSKLFKWSFQWFEFYHTILSSIFLFSLGALIIAFIIEILAYIFKIKKDKNFLKLIYLSGIFPLLVLFYGSRLVYNIFNLSFFEPIGKISALILFCLSIVVYLFILLKRKSLTKKFSNFYNNKTYNKIIQNLMFFIVLFLVISFALDLYTINVIPSSSGNKNLNTPNIILITLDTVRADHLSIYGYNHKTAPHLTNLSKNSLIFQKAIAQSSWTLPTHSSMFTGKYSSEHGANARIQELPKDEIIISQILKNEGYNTAAFVGGPYAKAVYGFGKGFNVYKDRMDFIEDIFIIDTFRLRSFISFHFDFLSFKQDGERTSPEINKDVITWLNKNEGPFFLSITSSLNTKTTKLDKEVKPVPLYNSLIFFARFSGIETVVIFPILIIFN
jgi:hypothetical protein